MIVENIYSCASVDNHIPRDDIFDYHPRRECNIYILFFKVANMDNKGSQFIDL